MNHKLKFYMQRNKVLSRREALQLLSDLSSHVFNAKTFEPNRKVFWGVLAGLLGLSVLFVVALVHGLYHRIDGWVMAGIAGEVLVIAIGVAHIMHFRRQLAEAEAQAYRNAHHIEKVLKLSEVIADLIPPQIKDSIDLNFYEINSFQKYYQSLRRFMMTHMQDFTELVEAEEKALIEQEEERQRHADLNLMGKEERGERNLKISPKHKAILEQRRKKLLEGIYADEESAFLHEEPKESGE